MNVVEAIQSVTAKLQNEFHSGERSAGNIDLDDLIDVLLMIAEKLEGETND